MVDKEIRKRAQIVLAQIIKAIAVMAADGDFLMFIYKNICRIIFII